MIINGRELADTIYIALKKRVQLLKKKGITPHLVVFLLGENPASLAYIAQKKLHAELIHAKVTVITFPVEVKTTTLLEEIEKYNSDPNTHAILAQKPFPPHINVEAIDNAIIPQKDVDGFNPLSTFVLALPLAVIKILEYVYQTIIPSEESFHSWLKTKNIVVLGKGPTAGGPTIKQLQKLGLHPIVIDSKTENRKELLQQADIIIAAIGKEQTVTANDIKTGVILIGVGVHKGNDGKIHGDYEEEDIKDIASFYTPTPKGVGPINVACLMDNVVRATEQQSRTH